MKSRMRRWVAAVGSGAFFVVGPGTITALIPWLLTGWRLREVPFRMPIRVVGILLLGAGAIVLAQAFARFVSEGFGTPAPVAPPSELVIGGFYRHVRNPMYVALLAIVTGQALLLAQFVLLAYAAILWTFAYFWVRYREEPVLVRRFGEAFETYRGNVPAWWPRFRPWNPR